ACFPRIEKGVAPACARACPARAVHFGFLEDESSSVYKLVKKWRVALPLHPEFNTEPNVYYVPPLSSPKFDKDGRLTNEERIPLDYLKYLFGPEVERVLRTLKEEREKMRRGEDSELMRTLIGFRWPDEFFGRFRQALHKVLVEK
ncbi:MAG: respiratory nitrate reductase subunit beta, partial [Archaeoglobaceae archaeon]